MRDGRKVKNNLIVGVLGQFVSVFLGVLVPKLVLKNYGSEINGLLTSVTNIYAYIAIVEAGVAAASCQALYRPITEKNYQQANAVLSATNYYYHRTGLIYLLLIGLLSVTYPVLIKSDIPYGTIVLVILFNGLGNVINYFFHGKYLILLKADGRNYIRMGLEVFTNAAKQISKIVLITLGFDVVFVQLAAMLASFVQMMYISIYVRKRYSWLDLKCKPSFKSISQSKNVFIHEINYLITSNVDVVFLSAFKTLKVVSVYSLYTLLFGVVNRVLRVIKDALEFKIAREFHKDRQSFIDLFQTYEIYYITFSFSLFTIACYFILPFMELYTEGVTDINYINRVYPVLFVLTHLLSSGRYPSDAMIHIAGHFKQTQNSAIMESLMNIVVSFALVHNFGIVGVLMGTILSSLYRSNYLVLYVNKYIIGRSPKGTYLCWGVNLVIFLFIMAVSRYIVLDLQSYGKIILCCIPYAISVFAVYFTVISLCNRQAFLYVIGIVKGILKNK